MLTNKRNNNSSQLAYFYPKLKHRQRLLHRIRAFIRLFNFIIFCLLVYCFYLLWNLDLWNIKNVEFKGLSKEGYTYISRFNIEDELIGKNIFTVNPSKVRNILNNISIFRKITIYRSLFPPTLSINFTERKPYLEIYDNNLKKDLFIDSNGFILHHIKKITKKDKIIYFINKTDNIKISSEQLNIIKVIDNFRKNKIINDLGIYNITNYQNIILNTPDNVIFLGGIDNFVKKIEAVPALEGLSKEHKNKLEYIDVRYSENHVLKLKKGSDPYEKNKKEHTD